MQEAVYSSLAASFEYYHRTGKPPPRTGNRQAGLSSAPYNVYPDHRRACRDPHRHRGTLEEPDGGDGPRGFAERPALRDQCRPRRAHGRDRRRRRRLDQDARQDGGVRRDCKAGRVPCAPVRTAPEVMNDPHMHERGMLEHVEHPELGDIVVPTSPLRLHGAATGADAPEPQGRPAQRRDLRRLAWVGRGRSRGVEGGRRDLRHPHSPASRRKPGSTNQRWGRRKSGPRLAPGSEFSKGDLA